MRNFTLSAIGAALAIFAVLYWLVPGPSRNVITSGEAFKRFDQHESLYLNGQEGPKEYLEYGAILASAMKDEQLVGYNVDQLQARLWLMLSNLSKDKTVDRQLYDAVSAMLQSYYNAHHPEPTPPVRSMPTPVFPQQRT